MFHGQYINNFFGCPAILTSWCVSTLLCSSGSSGNTLVDFYIQEILSLHSEVLQVTVQSYSQISCSSALGSFDLLFLLFQFVLADISQISGWSFNFLPYIHFVKGIGIQKNVFYDTLYKIINAKTTIVIRYHNNKIVTESYINTNQRRFTNHRRWFWWFQLRYFPYHYKFHHQFLDYGGSS